MSKTFEQFVSEGVEEGGATAHLFLSGVAVNAHIFAKDRSHSFVTRDVDLLLHRTDLDRVAKAAEAHGYAKKIMGGYMLIRPEQKAAEAVHILFVGEKSKSTQSFPHPELHPEETQMFGLTFSVAPLKDLLQMKLTSFGPKDVAQLEVLDDLGLITPALEEHLPSILKERLKEARKQIAAGKPDIEG
jgi:hypothetical protein